MEYHYVYSITYTNVPNIYYGVRTSKCLPEKDTKYWGSPSTFKAWMDTHKNTRVKTILDVYPTRDAAELAEDELIEFQWAIAKPLSLNAGLNGTKFNRLGCESSEKQKVAARIANLGKKPSQKCIEMVRKTQTGRKRTSEEIAAISKPFFLVSPSGEVFEGCNFTQFARDKGICRNNCIAVMKGRFLHYKGWTASLAAHELYLGCYVNRGITRLKAKNLWCIQWYENSKRQHKCYSDKSSAISFRDELELKLDTEFRVACVGWKKLLSQQAA
jgi:hypothetical protein